MLQDTDDPVSIHRFEVLSEASAYSLHHNKKRKSRGEQQEWPASKHTCFTLASTSDAQNIESTSEPDSINDSNCLTTVSDSIASPYDPGHVIDEYDPYQCAADGQLEDHHFEMHGENGGYECIGEEEDKDLEELLYSDCSKVNPNMFVLSSGRWVDNQDDDQSATRKPTIDHEFEQYFSTLML